MASRGPRPSAAPSRLDHGAEVVSGAGVLDRLGRVDQVRASCAWVAARFASRRAARVASGLALVVLAVRFAARPPAQR